MIRWSYPVLALFIFIVIGFGLILTAMEGVETAGLVKPHHDPEKGRLISHMKNTTHLSGTAAEVHEKMKEAIPYFEAQTADFAPTLENWKQFVKSSITTNPDSKHVILLPSGKPEALEWALPAIFYAKYHGSPVVFADEIEGNQALLESRKVFVIGPEELLSTANLGSIRDFERITARNPAALAVKIARYRDNETEFGWGRSGDRKTGYFQFLMATPSEAIDALAALPLARSNAATVLYTDEKGGLPAVTDAYIWSQRADWFVTPSEGPFRHFWVVSSSMSYKAQSRMDFSVEKSEYPTLGAVALGPLEAVVIIFIFLGIAGGIFIMVHSSYTLPMVSIPVKIAWTMGAMVLPILGVILYFNAYRRPFYKEDGMMRWLRPQNIQSAAATMMGFGYGAPLMIAIGYLLAYFGFPIFFSETLNDSVFWLGAGMPVMMMIMYFGAIIVAALMVHYPMKETMMEMKDGKLIKQSFRMTFISMTMVSLGMMTFTWWFMMTHLPMMPAEDDILWFGTLWIASFSGFIVAWPFNWIMIRKEIKHGNR
ncbi:DUF4396 domain-containing protein [Antarcticibacterium flavum]|uniref:DUF4396 domain-containing protein n=1 Tax=Antarcticibacterium flavum TaxID=2058175 RepID=A0A5B7X1J8_9FLAO|nr:MULTISPECIES: DUF4396 domain-containing protein [Antarcticibacterium]MCM4158626.1 hypothetical protein [Antarcticibacterium sp. W02-3]QCY68481.1 DUF4396 domain-containing protein [Antarcticibacterium flavum]